MDLCMESNGNYVNLDDMIVFAIHLLYMRLTFHLDMYHNIRIKSEMYNCVWLSKSSFIIPCFLKFPQTNFYGGIFSQRITRDNPYIFSTCLTFKSHKTPSNPDVTVKKFPNLCICKRKATARKTCFPFI